MSRRNEQTYEHHVATIAGKEYVQTSTSWEDLSTGSLNHYRQESITDVWSHYCQWGAYISERDDHKVHADALLKIIETVDKRINDVYSLVSAVEKKLDQHIEDDYFTKVLKGKDAVFDMLQKKHEELQATHTKLALEHEKLQEEKNKLDEWKAKLQKQFE